MIAMIKTIIQILNCPNKEASINRTTREGIIIIISANLMRILSVMPPTYPHIIPMVVPRTILINAEASPTIKATLAPSIS